MQDRHTKRLYRLHDFSKSQPLTPDHLWCVSGKVNSADKLYLVIESVKIDSKNTVLAPATAPVTPAQIDRALIPS
jgi:hypothetical protein